MTAPALTPTPKRAARPTPSCPDHGDALEGGPIRYRCPVGRFGHAVPAADINREVTR